MTAQSALDRAHAHATNYLNTLAERPVHPTATFDDLRNRLHIPLPDQGVPDSQVIDDLVADVSDGLMASSGGRFFGWVIGGTVPAAIAADWLTSVWDQNAAAPACSPASAIIEEVCGDWLKSLLGLPMDVSFGLVTGCQAAHTTALAAARHRLLTARGWNAETDGLYGAPPLRLITSESRHESLIRSMRLLGMGTKAIEHVDCNEDGSISLSTLGSALSHNTTTPTIVCLQAGDLNTGAFDDFKQAIPLAKRSGAWVHVDGAFGLWAAADSAHAHLMAGIEAADSWATDGHKMLNLPFDSGFVFIADPEAHSAALSQPTSYSARMEGVRNQKDWNLEWSRRARGYPVYAALRALGRRGVADMINTCCTHAKRLVRGLGEIDDVEVLADPIFNQGLVRFVSKTGEHDNYTDAVIARIQADGAAWFGGATWRHQRVMRVSVCSWRTTESDVETAIACVRRILT